tara:strand:+ start:7316 stop:7573 length:258 start_codon:yes stop_codon:yes gene_type:complete
MTTSAPEQPVEKVSQTQMLTQFKERLQSLINENQELSKKIKDNEIVALKLQGAIEALEYYDENPPGSETVDNLDTDESPGTTTEE